MTNISPEHKLDFDFIKKNAASKNISFSANKTQPKPGTPGANPAMPQQSSAVSFQGIGQNPVIRDKKTDNVEKNPDIVTTDITEISRDSGNHTKDLKSFASIFSIENGYFGTRGEEDSGTYIAGIYRINPDNEVGDQLVKMPDWTKTEILVDGKPMKDAQIVSNKLYFDTKKGASARELKLKDSEGRLTTIRTEKFAALSNKHLGGKTITVTPENYDGEITVRTGIDSTPVDKGFGTIKHDTSRDFITTRVVTPEEKFKNGEPESAKTVSMAQKVTAQGQQSIDRGQDGNFVYDEIKFNAKQGSENTVNALVNIRTSLDANQDEKVNLKTTDFKEVEKTHQNQFQQKMDEAGIFIGGDNQAQRYANYSTARLVMAGAKNDENHSITARTLTGPGYAGHIFWDFEIFDLPFFVHTQPEMAKTMLEYRYNTLDGARKNREEENKLNGTDYKGAKFAWESSSNGIDRTPPVVTTKEGETIKILTGTHEKHITPNIAYAAHNYWQVTGDDEFMKEKGAALIFEAARYSRSILEKGEDGKLHTKNLIGPDEYHEGVEVNPRNGELEGVNDNAYTNAMIQHNLNIAREVAQHLKKEGVNHSLAPDSSELKDWEQAGKQIYIPYDHKNDVIEQFEGFSKLRDIDLSRYTDEEKRKYDAVRKYKDNENPNGDKVIKQPDTLMLMALKPNDYTPDTQRKVYEYYEPKTVHGSSLSVGIHSLMASRLGKKDDAYKYYMAAGGMDVDNQMGNAADGIHAATLGATWQALTKGFGGMHVSNIDGENGLMFKPSLPDKWKSLGFKVKWHGQPVKVFATQNTAKFTVESQKGDAVPITLDGKSYKKLEPGKEYTAVKRDNEWQWKEQPAARTPAAV